MDEGWFKIYRSLINSEYWTSEPFSKPQAWVDLIGLANYEDGFIIVHDQRIELKRGDVGWSLKRLAQRWQWSPGKVKRFLKRNELDRQIVFKTERPSLVISICNYEKFQSKRNADDRQNESKVVGKTEPIKETKEEKKKRNNTNAQKSKKIKQKEEETQQTPHERRFDSFWKSYPKKKSKGQAEKAWDKIRPSEQLLEKILNSLELAKTSVDWRKDKGKYIPYPATWLNAKGWEDVHETEVQEAEMVIYEGVEMTRAEYLHRKKSNPST